MPLCDSDVCVSHDLGEDVHRHAAMRGETRESVTQLVELSLPAVVNDSGETIFRGEVVAPATHHLAS
jgi:hypothetical protein